MHCIKTANSCFIDNSFRTTADNDVTHIQPNIVIRIDHGIGRRSTCRNGGKIGSPKAIFYGNMTGNNVNDYFWDEEGVYARSTIAQKKGLHFVLKGFKTANTRAPDYAYTVGIQLTEVKITILYGFVSGD